MFGRRLVSRGLSGRAIGILAHVDAGKTTTTEQLLFVSGQRRAVGRVDAGSTCTDFLPQERERGITIQSAAVHLEWKGAEIALIDTPGHVDFGYEVDRSLAVLDGVVLVVDAVAGAQARTEVVARSAKMRGIPTLVLVNKMDRAGADFDRAVASVRDRCGLETIPVHSPTPGFTSGFEDVLAGVAYDLDDEAAPARDDAAFRRVVEAVSDFDDQIAEAYVSDAEVTREDVSEAVARATATRRCAPVLCGAMLRGVGTRALLDAVVRYLPASSNVEAYPFKAVAFKVTHDKRRGPLVFCRAIQGTLRAKQTLFSNKTTREKPTALLRPFADDFDPVSEVFAGDIFVAVGLKATTSGHTLSTEPNVSAVPFPIPGNAVFSLAVEPERSADYNQLVSALRLLARDDPSLRVSSDDDDDQDEIILSGMGELHLEVAKDRLRREHGITALFGTPAVAYRESVEIEARTRVCYDHALPDAHHRIVFGSMTVRVEPGPHQVQITIPDTLNPDIRDALRDGFCSAAGPLEGRPLANVWFHVSDVDVHPQATPGAARAAAALALRDLLPKARPIVLEPIMHLAVHTPPATLGDVLTDLSRKRNTHVDAVQDDRASLQLVTAQAPLAELLGFATHLRSITHGQATFDTHYSHHAPRL
ncbi:hypothetical protein CTAYLR_000120 [Chrysophaeum taylorii]|uniref:Tr-type G domain-containing protein n=1 Tax=Chrysophaeum taylorii TaxID=2483200 RepID=A0AAD7UJ10_9STRA|nr:hypothetical protein CTAYLR_000120 [Chrysophaeum taylorii]